MLQRQPEASGQMNYGYDKTELVAARGKTAETVCLLVPSFGHIQ